LMPRAKSAREGACCQCTLMEQYVAVCILEEWEPSLRPMRRLPMDR